MSTLYRKYRPSSWSEIAGQNHVKVTLAYQVASSSCAHAYLFAGPRGVGKTTAARILARAVNCAVAREGRAGEPCGECESCHSIAEHRALDVIEIDAASYGGVDGVREHIIENVRTAPAALKRKVFIIDEAHMLTPGAWAALLKTLEEPPAHCLFVLATTELHKVPLTILSRCQRFDFRRISFTDMVERLHALAEREKIKVDRRVLEEIARHSDGCLRDAEGLLGKVMTAGDGKRISYDEAALILPRSDSVLAFSFAEALLRRDARTAVAAVGDAVDGGVDPDRFAEDAIDLLRKAMLTAVTGEVDLVAFDMDDESKKRLAGLAALADARRIARAVEILLEKRQDVKLSQPPQLPLEIAAVLLASDNVFVPTAALVSAAPVPASAPRAAGGVSGFDEEVSKISPSTQPLEKVRAVWAEFVRRAGEESHSLSFLLSVAEPVAVDGGRLRVGFGFPFHRDKFNEIKNLKLLEKALEAALGAPMRLEGLLLEKKDGPSHTDAAPYGGQAASAPAVKEIATAQAGGAAEGLIAVFGGSVVE